MGTLTPLLLALAPAPAAPPVDVLVVGGTAPTHASLQDAVDAAADGDVVLVWPGGYAHFAIFDKSLTVAARQPGTVAISGMVRVQELAAHRRVALVGLSVAGNGKHALRLADCEGAVRVEGGSFRGTDLAQPWHDPQNDGVHITGCADVAISGAVLQGGRGVDAGFTGGGPASGGDGLDATGSRVTLHACALAGADGGSDGVGEGYDGGNGGAGARLLGGYVLASASSFHGGDGGDGGEEDGCVPLGNEAGDGGDGGDGLRLEDGSWMGLGPARAETIAFTAAPGAGGAGGLGYCGPNGSPGAPGLALRVLGASSAAQHPWTARSLHSPGPWRTGQSASVTFAGEPGDRAWLLRSGRTAFLPDAGKKGVRLLGGMVSLHPMGILDASGALTRALPVPAAPAGFEGATVFLQAWLDSPADGLHLTGSVPAVVLHPAF